MSERRQPPIAIVGIGCLFPAAADLQTYWANVLAARDCLSDVPPGHSWSTDDYFDADPTVPDKTWATRGGFLDKVPFDPMQFGIPPNILESIDTSQLLSLIVAREALRDAGMDPDSDTWNRDRVSCIIGVTGTQEMAITAGARLQGPIWRKSMLRCGVDPALADVICKDIANHFPTWTEQTFPGLLGNVVAGRISNRLDLGGTNAVVDAACASSLAAMQYAISDLMAGRSDVVLSGGVDALNDIFMFECFTRTPAFTKKGDARPFDQEADGILIGEGLAIVALKRLEDAERDGDRVYAVIKGLGSSSDGRHRSIYAPNPDGQAKALRRTYAMAGVTPETIELVEAHGTGTKAGDVAEISALSTVYGACGRQGQWVALGSVKSQIGHTKSTAGAAGLVKAALALHQRVLPPTAKIDTPNPKMGFDTSPFYLSPRARPWIRAADHPRRAAVSAFGFGGSNFHALLEEHGSATVGAQSPAETELFLLGAGDTDAMAAALDALGGPTITHASRACLEAWRPGAACVVAFTADSLPQLAERVTTAHERLGGAPERPRDGVFLGGGPAPKVACVFPGQGSQYVEMGRDLAVRHPAVRAAFDSAEETFRDRGWPSLAARVFPPPAWTDEGEQAHAEGLRATEWAQPAIGAVSKGMADLLSAFGVRPHVVAGHSYGELVALHVAGALTAEALWVASRTRGELMSATDQDRGTMAAVDGPLAEIESGIEAIPDVVLANRNHPTQGVISGARSAVAAAIEALASKGLTAKELRVAAAFHSSHVADAHGPFLSALHDLDISSPRLPVWSGSTASVYPTDPDGIRTVLADQILEPVDWVGVVDALVQDGVQVVVECGPRGVLAGLTQRCLDTDVTVVSLDRLAHKAHGDTQLKTCLARLAAAGVPIDPSPLLAERPPSSPRAAAGPATVWLGGANHREQNTLEPPMPELPPARPAEPVVVDNDGWGSVPSSGAPMAKPVHLERAEADPTEPAPPAAPGPSLPPSSDLVALLESTRQTLSAFQAAQERTAEVHGKFLDAFAQSNDNFARLFEAQATLVERVAAGGVGVSLPRAPVQPVPPPLAVQPVQPAPSPTPAPAPTDALFTPEKMDRGRVNTSNATTAVAHDLPPIFDAAAAVQAGRSTPAPATPPVATEGLRDAVLAAVATKTGYPQDALELSMDLEADLGIDSIKRVEILSAVREARPDLPELDNEVMAALRTLGEVVDTLKSAGGAPSVPVTRGPSIAALTDALMQAVAAKTGYPQDALELSMDLEADLGIDSIKRVEILSAVREAVPGLPELDNEVLAALRTLEEVAAVLAEAAGAPAVMPDVLLPSEPPDRDAMISALLGAVADKTGYPREALELSMDLESDLGVDSIKRVEILSAVRERMPELPELDNEVLASLGTLQNVADHLCTVAAGLGFAMIGAEARNAGTPALLVPPRAPERPTPPPPALPPVQSASELAPPLPPLALRRAEVRCTDAPALMPGPTAGRWLLTSDAGGRAEAVARILRERGAEVDVIDPDWTQPAVEVPTGLTGVVHMAALGAPESTLEARVRGAFLIAKATGPVDRFVTVGGRGGRFGRGTPQGHPLEGALAGLPKTLVHEWLDCRPLALDIAEDTSAEAIAAEITGRRGVVEVGLSGRGACTLGEATDSVELDEAEWPLTSGDLVVVSGGARGVTAHCVRAMASHTPLAFLLLGRSDVPEADPAWAVGVPDDQLVARCIQDARGRDQAVSPKQADAAARTVRVAREVRATMSDLEALGAVATYAALDARDPEAVASAVAAAVEAHGPVRGLVHGAGVLADKAIAEKTAEQFDRVWSTKVGGLHTLIAACPPSDLRAVVMFSSIAGRRGNRGQVDYAMANEALVHHALDLVRAHPALVAKALDWGPWDGGMVTPSLKAHFEALGHTLVPLHAGAQACVAELARPGTVEVLFEGPRPPQGHEDRRLVSAEPWLRDHTIGDHPVVPAAMVLEWMAETAAGIAPSLRVSSVRDLQVLTGIVIDGEGRSVRLSWQPAPPRSGSAAIAFEVSSGPNTTGLPVVHYRAVVDLTDADSPRTPHPGSNGLGADPYPYAVDEAYRRFLFHGPQLRGIDEIVGMSDQGAVAFVRTSTPAAFRMPGSRWNTDPLAVDSALQLMLLWVREKHGSAALPTVLGEYRQFAPLVGRLACHLEIEDGATQTTGRFGATFVDDAGTIVATLMQGEYTAKRSLIHSFQAK